MSVTEVNHDTITFLGHMVNQVERLFAAYEIMAWHSHHPVGAPDMQAYIVERSMISDAFCVLDLSNAYVKSIMNLKSLIAHTHRAVAL